MFYHAMPLDCSYPTAPSTLCFLDIETTGLCKEKDAIVAIGLIHHALEKWTYHYWLVEALSDEPLMLSEVLHFLEGVTTVYTFGGGAFDLAFLSTRIQLFNQNPSALTVCQHVDLKKLLLWKVLFPQRSFKRAELEHFLHYSRSISSNGRELVKIIHLYLSNPTPIYKEIILTHNKEDLLSLLTIYAFYDFLFHIKTYKCLAFTCEKDFVQCKLEPSQVLSCDMTLTLGAYKLTYLAHCNELTILLACKQLTLKQYLPAKDYYEVNGQLVHKTLAECIPHAYKRKVSKENAFLMQTACYIPDLTKEAIWEDATQNTYLPYDTTTYSLTPFLTSLHKIITRGLIN